MSNKQISTASMANNRNEIVYSGTNSDTNSDTKQTHGFIYCDVPNATNEGLPMSESRKSFYKVLTYLISSIIQKIQSRRKKFNKRKQSVSTPCKSVETCISLSSSVDSIIKPDAKTVARTKRKIIDTYATQYNKVFDKVTYENLPDAVEQLVHCASYRYAEYAAKHVDNAVPERGCGLLCIGTGTQSDIVDGEFSLETSSDAFARACEKRRHADFILEKIAKVSDALTETVGASRDFAKEQTASILASVSVTSAGYKMGGDEETFESTKPLISSVIHAEEESTAAAVADAAVTVMQPETLTDTLVTPSSYFIPDLRHFLACSDKSLDAPDIRVIPSVNLRKIKHTRTVSIMFPEGDDLRDIAVNKNKKKKEEKSLKISLQSTSDKCLLAVERTSYGTVIVNCIPKLKKCTSKTLGFYKPKDIQTDVARREAIIKDDITDYAKTAQIETLAQIAKDIQIDAASQEATIVKDDIIDSSEIAPIKETPTQIVKNIQIDAACQEATIVKDDIIDSCEIVQVGETPTQIVKDIPNKSVPFKQSKYRAKYRVKDSCVMKEKSLESKEISKDSDKILKYTCLSFPLPKTISRSFKCSERSAMELWQDYQSRLSRCLQPIKYCEDSILSNIYLGRSRYHGHPDIRFSLCSQNCEPDATLNHAHCRHSQDSCATKHRACCHSLIDSHASSRYCNVNADYTKHRMTFENSLCTNAYCKSDAKYCYPHLNSIDNARTGYYHYNDSCPIWNNNQQCGRDRSYYWTKGNLYFTHPMDIGAFVTI